LINHFISHHVMVGFDKIAMLLCLSCIFLRATTVMLWSAGDCQHTYFGQCDVCHCHHNIIITNSIIMIITIIIIITISIIIITIIVIVLWSAGDCQHTYFGQCGA